MTNPVAIAPPSVAQVRALFAGAQRALIVTHVSPDGDAWGSALGLSWALRAAAKETVVACADPMLTETFRFLPGAQEVTTKPQGLFDLIVVVDVSEARRMGVVGDQLPRRPDLVFDHHITNPGFATHNIIDAEAASTAELLTEWLARLHWPLPKEAAECLLAGVITDTLGFRTPNTSPRTFEALQQLVAAGAELSRVYDLAFYKRSYSGVRLWAEGLSSLKLEDGVVWARLPLAARKVAAYGGTGDADLINVLASVREARIALIFVERTEGKVKISWRSDPPINVSVLAQAFGGGGHVNAAGAEVVGTLAEVEARVVAAAKAALKDYARR